MFQRVGANTYARSLGNYLATVGAGLTQPVVLTKPDGTVWVNADGDVLTRGTRIVTPIE
jgi:hypothetical protein